MIAPRAVAGVRGASPAPHPLAGANGIVTQGSQPGIAFDNIYEGACVDGVGVGGGALRVWQLRRASVARPRNMRRTQPSPHRPEQHMCRSGLTWGGTKQGMTLAWCSLFLQNSLASNLGQPFPLQQLTLALHLKLHQACLVVGRWITWFARQGSTSVFDALTRHTRVWRPDHGRQFGHWHA